QSNKQCRETAFGWFFCDCVLACGDKVAMVWRHVGAGVKLTQWQSSFLLLLVSYCSLYYSLFVGVGCFR
ncbi:hypothetical protein ACVZZ3_004478, partial [Escherichia coli]